MYSFFLKTVDVCRLRRLLRASWAPPQVSFGASSRPCGEAFSPDEGRLLTGTSYWVHLYYFISIVVFLSAVVLSCIFSSRVLNVTCQPCGLYIHICHGSYLQIRTLQCCSPGERRVPLFRQFKPIDWVSSQLVSKSCADFRTDVWVLDFQDVTNSSFLYCFTVPRRQAQEVIYIRREHPRGFIFVMAFYSCHIRR